MIQRLAEALKSKRIRISVRYSRNIAYTEEYHIENMEGEVIQPWDFPWDGKVFQLLEEDKDVRDKG